MISNDISGGFYDHTLPHERKYVLSPENVQVAHDIADAIAAKDYEKMDELAKKMILPLSLLKGYGKERVLEVWFADNYSGDRQ